MLNDTTIKPRVAAPGVVVFLLLACAAMCQTPEPRPAVKRVVAMEYPWIARMASLQGTVELIVAISSDGAAQDVRIVSGPEALAVSAKETLSKWRFTGCSAQTGKCEARFFFYFVLKGSCNVAARCPSDFQVDLPDEITVVSKTFDGVLY